MTDQLNPQNNSTSSVCVVSDDINIQIKKIFDENKVTDLKRFLEKRKYLNHCNVIYVYLFTVVQILGIFVTAIATVYDQKFIVLIGIGLTLTATMIHGWEKINTSMLKSLLKNIKNIKDDKYIDEEELKDIQNINTNLSLGGNAVASNEYMNFSHNRNTQLPQTNLRHINNYPPIPNNIDIPNYFNNDTFTGAPWHSPVGNFGMYPINETPSKIPLTGKRSLSVKLPLEIPIKTRSGIIKQSLNKNINSEEESLLKTKILENDNESIRVFPSPEQSKGIDMPIIHSI